MTKRPLWILGLLWTLPIGCERPLSAARRDDAEAEPRPSPRAERGGDVPSASPGPRAAQGGVRAAEPKGGGAGKVPAAALRYVEAKVSVDVATGRKGEDAFLYFRLWGHFENASTETVEDIVADIRYFDSSGKELGVDSILTGVKKDVGDASPGEPIRGAISFVPPGGSVPVTHIRSLDKLGGTYASHTVTLRPAWIAGAAPAGVLEGPTDVVAEVANENLQGASPLEHRVVAGTLRNTGKAACASPGLVVGFYDAAGKLADVREDDAKVDVLEPGKSAPVKVFTLVGFSDAWKAKAPIKTWVRCSPR